MRAELGKMPPDAPDGGMASPDVMVGILWLRSAIQMVSGSSALYQRPRAYSQSTQSGSLLQSCRWADDERAFYPLHSRRTQRAHRVPRTNPGQANGLGSIESGGGSRRANP